MPQRCAEEARRVQPELRQGEARADVDGVLLPLQLGPPPASAPAPGGWGNAREADGVGSGVGHMGGSRCYIMERAESRQSVPNSFCVANMMPKILLE